MTWRRARGLVGWTLVMLTLGTACASGAAPSPAAPRQAGQQIAEPPAPGAAATAIPRKTMTWILDREPEGFTELFGGSASTHWRMVYHAIHDFLVALDNNAEPVARLAARIPSRDDGSWVINPDGTMETTWQLRPGVTWHNGEPFRAADYVLGWRVARDPNVPWNKRGVATIVDRIDTPDDNTLVLHWSKLYPFADRIQPFDLDPLPSWNRDLVDTFENRKPELSGHSWFSRDFVGLGPYRLTAMEPGSHLVLEANESWYGGRPKISRIEVRPILDDNTLLAAMLAGEGDFTHSLDVEQWRIFDEQAVRASRGQLIRHKVGRITLAIIKQANPLFGGTDKVKQRQAMLHALDRPALAELMTGDTENAADSWLFKASPKYAAIKDRVATFPYNTNEALRLLAETGWTRGGDGLLQHPSLGRFTFDYWTGSNDPAAPVLREYWHQAGIEMNIIPRPPRMNADLEYRASFPGVQSSGNATSLAFIDGRFHSRNIPRPENRWGGLNWGGYVDSEVDQLVEKLLVTIDRGEAWQVEGEILSRVSRDVVYFPYFLRTSVGAAAKGFSGVKVIGEACQSGDCEVSWNIAEWDIVR